MAIDQSFIPIGETGEKLDSVKVDTPAGAGLHRETVVFADPENPAGLGKVTNAAPAADAYGAVVRVAGQVVAAQASPYAVTQSGAWTVTVGNFPATQAVSGTVTANQGGAWTVGRTWSLTFASDKADVSGSSISVSNFPATQAVSGTVTANQGGTWNINNITGTVSLPTGAATAAKQLPDNHNVTVSNLPLEPLTGANSSVAASVTEVTLLASNDARRGATIYNDSASSLKLSLGSVVTASSFTLVVAGGGYYEVPFGYRGTITGLWAAAIGAARVTELT